MLKFILIFFISIISIDIAKCCEVDTAVIYYKYEKAGYYKVADRDQCDFFRMITSPDEGDSTYNVKEFFKDGHLKLVGKALPKLINNDGLIALQGDCISYFETGKRKCIIHYSNGNKEGDEYLFYPNGKIYALIKNPLIRPLHGGPKSWECYDINGNMVCIEGNGKWMLYDPEFKNVTLRGYVKNGERDGEWRGGIERSDSIKYRCIYKNGTLKSSVGYDKNGNAFPFKSDFEPAYYNIYNTGPFDFLRTLQSNLVLPKDEKGRKISADSVIISFIVEKNGKVSHFETLGEVNPDLRIAIKTALYKCKDWTSRKNYGVPVRSKIILSMKYLSKRLDKGIVDMVHYSEAQINDDE
jgi:antitoxin component YwqK of YwqJK toxin-antitoxin module